MYLVFVVALVEARPLRLSLKRIYYVEASRGDEGLRCFKLCIEERQ